MRHLSFATLEASDPRDIYRTLATELFRVLEVDCVHICRLAQDGSLARSTRFAPGDPEGAGPEREHVVPLHEPSGLHHVARTGRPLNVPDAPSSPVVSQELVSRFGVESALFVPLWFEGEVRAVALAASGAQRRFAPEDEELAYTMANQAAAGLAVLEMRGRLGGRADKHAALARAARALNARLDLQAVLDTLCREAGLALGGDLACVYLGDARSGGVGAAAHGLPEGSDWWGCTIRAGEGVAGRVLETGEPTVSNDHGGDPGAPGADALQGVETALAVPVRWSAELKGALSVGFRTMRRVAREDRETLEAIADLAAVACSNAEAFEQAQAAARTDSLTGFLNHGAIQVRIREEIWRARRSGAPLSCLLLDLDNFKPINDGHGHLVGDELLQHVAAAVTAEFRPYDGMARYGGDEFVLVLPGTDEAEARSAARRLREAVAEAGGKFGDLGAPVTASVGIARWHEPLTASELLDRADRALLLAKRRGKDRVVTASADTEHELARMEDEDGPSDLMSAFWDTVSRCEKPRHVMYTLPAFLRRVLGLEEVALYEPGAGSQGRSLIRLAVGRAPGDPGPSSFRCSSLTVGDGLARRLEGGPISRGSLPAIRRALEVQEEARAESCIPGSYAAIGMVRGGALHGLLLLRHSSLQFPRTVLRRADVLAAQAVTVLLGQSGNGSRSAVAALAAAIDARDNYTMTHSEEVVGLACEVARRLRLPPAEVSKIRDGAMLHDIGKVAIPNEILYKAGSLTRSEWEVMREHPLIGESILLRTPELAPIASLVRHEHEQWNGNGYPDGLAGEAIPIGSRIIFACDAYNAMITARPYRDPMSHEDALGELRRCAGSQFDPAVVEALLEVAGTGEPAAPAGGRA